jgi:hypothetical protein
METKYVVVAIAFGVPIAGVGHLLYEFGVPLWGVVPLVLAGWAALGFALRRHAQAEGATEAG